MSFFSKLFGFNSEPAAQPVEQPQTDEELIGNVQKMMLLMEVKRQAELYGDTDTVHAVLNMTYDGPMPEQQPDGSYSRIYELQDYNIAGINYRENVAAYLGDFEGYLKPDPENEHDPNAIAVYAYDGHHLGFVPAACTDYIRSLGRSFQLPITGTITQEHDDIEDRYYFEGTFFIYVLNR